MHPAVQASESTAAVAEDTVADHGMAGAATMLTVIKLSRPATGG